MAEDTTEVEAEPTAAPSSSLLTRYLKRLRSVSVRNLCLPGRPASPPPPGAVTAAAPELPSTRLQVLARPRGEAELRAYHTSEAAPSTLNPTWLLLDLGHCAALPEQLEDDLCLRVVLDGGGEAALASPLPRRAGGGEGEEGGVVLECNLNVRELWCVPTGPGLARVHLPANALLMATGDTGDWLVVGEALLEHVTGAGAGQPQWSQCRNLDEAVLQEMEEEHPTYGGAGAGVEESEREAVEVGMAALSTEDAEEQMGRVLAEAALVELQALLSEEELLLADDEAALRRQEGALAEDLTALEGLMERGRQEEGRLEEARRAIRQEREGLLQKEFLLEARQMKLLGELQRIYPIRRLPNQDYAIRGLELPADVANTTRDDEHISSALGYVCHLVFMLSKYLQVPLRYSLEYRSSRSQVKDAAVEQAVFPLYRKGVERERFDVGVGLLRKNIHQLLFARLPPRTTRLAADVHMLQSLQDLFAHELTPRAVP